MAGATSWGRGFDRTPPHPQITLSGVAAFLATTHAKQQPQTTFDVVAQSGRSHRIQKFHILFIEALRAKRSTSVTQNNATPLTDWRLLECKSQWAEHLVSFVGALN